MSRNIIKNKIKHYYDNKIRTFGPVPSGVDWNSLESQILRFDQFNGLFLREPFQFSLLDYGCGYGALLKYLTDRKVNVRYCGYDLSDSMIEHAIKTNSEEGATWVSSEGDLKHYDYVVASGIFNVKEDVSDKEWSQHVYDTLRQINGISTKGFAFNLLSKYSDPEKRKGNLFYADPAEVFDYCKTNFSHLVALLHDYPLFEFTIIVRKNNQ